MHTERFVGIACIIVWTKRRIVAGWCLCLGTIEADEGYSPPWKIERDDHQSVIGVHYVIFDGEFVGSCR